MAINGESDLSGSSLFFVIADVSLYIFVKTRNRSTFLNIFWFQ